MEQPYEEIHIGHIIQETLKKQGRSVAWLARELNYTRENMYNIFKSPRIDTDTLLKISLALDKNFFLLYSDFYKKRKEKITEV
ncbi:MAG: XRE family transcriptional regulator [Bacteroidales bacterium]|nr:XRE family transcriptional regulator [Bacteroidales bacterium]